MKFESCLLQNILQHSNIGVHVIDKNRKTIIYNDTMAKLEGIEKDKVLGKDLFEVFPSLNERTSTLVKSMNNDITIKDSTQTYLNYKGQRITTINTTMPIYCNGRLEGAMELANDITNVRKLSDQLLELQDRLSIHNKDLNSDIRKYNFDDIIGNNRKLQVAKDIGIKSTTSNSSVLIFGETGTGKEMFAQSIHYLSNRGNMPFVAQNCAAIPDSLLEGLLFGTEKGGFTGAVERKGIFEQAHGGTLLLDEINAMSLELQAKLLRVLQESYIRRIGGTKDIPIDVRIIATTNIEPSIGLEQNLIRRDLFYRISVLNINIPPLRERVDDIPILCKHFIKKYSDQLDKNIQFISDEVTERFSEYSWPGNIRELENFIESAVNLAPVDASELVMEDFISTNFRTVESDPPGLFNRLEDVPLNELLENIEKDMIQQGLEKFNDNITKTAEYLGMKRQTLQHKLKKYL